jgi:hypothetical protein
MRRRLIVALALSGFGAVLLPGVGPASGADGYGQDGHASGSASGSVVSVRAGSIVLPIKTAAVTHANSTSGSEPPNPYQCGYSPADAQDQQLLGPGGLEPGEWVVYACPGTTLIGGLPLQWIATAKPNAPANPQNLAEQAESKLALQAAMIQTSPPTGSEQLVGIPTWLWINSAAWKAMSATAAAGPVTATAVAAPAEVVWNMGDGSQVTCTGPGTPYSSADPYGTTGCSYTWTEPSTDQPDGEYQVTATIYWHVTWTAAGAPGGGDLGLRPSPPAQVAMRVTESQAINTATPGGN